MPELNRCRWSPVKKEKSQGETGTRVEVVLVEQSGRDIQEPERKGRTESERVESLDLYTTDNDAQLTYTYTPKVRLNCPDSKCRL